MTDEEKIQAEVERRIEQRDETRREVGDIVAETFKPMGDFLEQWKRDNLPGQVTRVEGKVDTLTAVQRTQGREIGELKGKVEKLGESMTEVKQNLAAIPGQRAEAIQKHVDGCRKERDQASGLIDTATEKGRAEAERLARARRGRVDSYAPAKKPNGALAFLRANLLYILIGLAAIGSWIAASGDGDTPEKVEKVEKAVEKAAKNSDDTHERLDRLQRLLEQAIDQAPATFDPNTGQPITVQPTPAAPPHP